MKLNILITSIFLSFLMIACFDDEGNYDYKELTEPTFLYAKSPVKVYGYLGEEIKCKGLFKYDTPDSLELMKNLEYEWIINEVSISKEKDLQISVDTLCKLLEIERTSNAANYGHFIVKNKETGFKSFFRVYVYIYPKFYKKSLIVLSETNGAAKVSYLNFFNRTQEDGSVVPEYTYFDNIENDFGNTLKLAGKPVKLIEHYQSNISSSMGATTVITDQGAWEINGENMKIVQNIKDEFLDGCPPNLSVKDIYYEGSYRSFLITNDGKIYIRKMSKNFLGGKYQSTPYAVDEKGYNAQMYAEGMSNRYKYNSLFYDKKNRRMLAVNQVSNIFPIEKATGNHVMDLTNLDEDIEILYLNSKTQTTYAPVNLAYEDGTMIYRQNGNIYAFDFTLHKTTRKFVNIHEEKYELNMQLREDSKIWIPNLYYSYLPKELGCPIMYTSGNQIRYFNRKNKTDNLYYEFDQEVTACMAHAQTGDRDYVYKIMGIGFKNGDFCLFDMEKKQIISNTKFNTGGKVVDIVLTGNKTYR